MKKIQILGTGCSKCNALAENTESALRLAGLDIPIEKVTDLQEILAAGIMMTPALVIDGDIKAVGKVLSPTEILEMLQAPAVQKDSPTPAEPTTGSEQESGTSPAKSGSKGTRIAIVVGLLLALGITLWAKNRGSEPAQAPQTSQTSQTAQVDPSKPIVEDGTETAQTSRTAGSPAASVPPATSVPSRVAAATPAGGQTATPAKPRPRMLDLGRGTCIPCKMMMPVLEELKTSLAGKLDVQYIDISKNPEAAQRWEVRIIPTQIFIDEEGNELTRHTGFFPRADILAEWKRIGYDFEAKTPAPDKQQD